MYCSRCGNFLPKMSLFCNRCGTKVQSPPPRFRRPSLPPPASSGRRSRRDDYYEDEEEYLEDDYQQFDEEEDGYRRRSRYADHQFAEEDEEEDEYYYVEDEDDEETEEEDEERIIFSINPAFYPVATSYVISIFVSIICVVVISFFKGPFWLIMTASFISFVPSIISHIKHMHTVFTLTNIKLEISQGLFSKSTRNIPLRHIQDVSVTETLRERMLGIGDIIVETAAADSNLLMNDVNDPRKYADMILTQLERWS